MGGHQALMENNLHPLGKMAMGSKMRLQWVMRSFFPVFLHLERERESLASVHIVSVMYIFCKETNKMKGINECFELSHCLLGNWSCKCTIFVILCLCKHLARLDYARVQVWFFTRLELSPS